MTAPPLLAIVGPTGVGKTAAALALAEAWPVEVVSVDSRQVYRRLDVGTGKPTAEERGRVPHHLVDVAEPDETFDAARFVREAAAAVREIGGRGRRCLLVGGTGLYHRALVRGLSPAPPRDPALRARLRAEAARLGRTALHDRLAAVDAGAAARLHPNDLVRVIRALEVALHAGGAHPDPGGWWSGPARRFRVLTVGLTAERAALYDALDSRVDRMLAGGLVDEVRGLVERGYGADLPAMQGIGYRHLVPVLHGTARLADAVAAMKRDTRRYAKRQWTWFAREGNVHWVHGRPGDAAAAAREIKNLVDRTGIFD